MLPLHSTNGFFRSGKTRPNANCSASYTKEARRELKRSEGLGRKISFLVIEFLTAVGFDLLKRYAKSWAKSLKVRVGSPAAGSAGLKASTVGSRDCPLEPGVRQTAVEKKSAAHILELCRRTASKWNQDKCSALGAALAYYTIFSLSPLILLLLGIFGLVYGSSQLAREKILEQLSYVVDRHGLKVIEDIANNAAQPAPGIIATGSGIIIALFGASGVFGQLQDALNTIWSVKPKPGAGFWVFIRARFFSFVMVAGVCFLLLVSLTVEGILKGLHGYLQAILPGGHYLGLAVFYLFDLGILVLLFAMLFRFLPDAKVAWNDVWTGAALTAVLFAIGKFLLGLYLSSGAAGSAFGAASSLITLLLWIFYSAQIVLFGAEFTKVHADFYRSKLVS